MIVGTIGSIEEPIAIAGGNCAIQGFDETGNERYWTITGDNIVSLALADLDSDGNNEVRVPGLKLSGTFLSIEKLLIDPRSSVDCRL